MCNLILVHELDQCESDEDREDYLAELNDPLDAGEAADAQWRRAQQRMGSDE